MDHFQRNALAYHYAHHTQGNGSQAVSIAHRGYTTHDQIREVTCHDFLDVDHDPIQRRDLVKVERFEGQDSFSACAHDDNQDDGDDDDSRKMGIDS